MTYTTFWITYVGSKELADFLFEGGIGGGWGDMLEVSQLVLSGD